MKNAVYGLILSLALNQAMSLRLDLDRTIGAVRSHRSVHSFFILLSRRHESPAPWRHSAFLLPLRGPPDFSLSSLTSGTLEKHLFRFFPNMQSLT